MVLVERGVGDSNAATLVPEVQLVPVPHSRLCVLLKTSTPAPGTLVPGPQGPRYPPPNSFRFQLKESWFCSFPTWPFLLLQLGKTHSLPQAELVVVMLFGLLTMMVKRTDAPSLLYTSVDMIALFIEIT